MPGPFEGFGRFIVVTDVAQEFAPQIGDGTEDASRDQIALDLGEPEFHLVEPGGVGWGVMKYHGRMALQERRHSFGFMGRRVVGDDVNRAPGRLVGDNLSQKATNSALVWRAAVWPTISPVRVSRAA
jgi:hypothetical protein